MKKRAFSFVLALALCLSSVVFSASASNQPTSGVCGKNATWAFNESTGVLTVSGSGSISFIWEGAWNEVSQGPIVDWAHLRPYIRSVVISEGITYIDAEAFAYCENLVNIRLPGTLESIGVGVFFECTSLKEISVPESVKRIYGNAFLGCALERIYLPANATPFFGLPFGFPSLGSMPKEIYYGGTQAQFEQQWGSHFETLPIVHYNSTKLPPLTAYARVQNILVDGTAVQFQTYALKDANGYETNYVKLRDVAHVLNGTAAQFNVGWDGAVNITPKAAYQANGSEMSIPFTGDRTYEYATAATNVNSVAADVDAILLKDNGGNGYTYYKLRDLGRVLGFNVGWSAEAGVYIESDRPYTEQ